MHDDEIRGRSYDARLMRRLIGYLRPYRVPVGVALAAIAGGSVLQLVPPYLTKIVIDQYIPSRDLSGLTTVAAVYLATLAAGMGLDFAQLWTMQTTGQRVMFDLRMQIMRHLQRLDMRFYDRNPVGRLMTRVTTDVDVLNELFTAGVVTVLGDVFTLAGITIVLVWLDWRLALVAFSVLPLIVLVTQWFRRHVRESYREVRTWIARINSFLQERLTGMATVQLFRREAADFAAFAAINDRHRRANVQSIFYYAVFYPAVELVSALAAALIIWVGGGWVIQEALTLGSLVAFLQYTQRFFRPISDLSEKFNVLQSAAASAERIFALLDAPGVDGAMEPGGAARARAGPRGPGEAPSPGGTRAGRRAADAVIRFEQVTFAYVDGEPVLREVSFEVRAGERVGIVGATGSGKTTIANLLLRFYDAQAGRILVDGRDVRDWPIAELRRQYALVPQDVHLFSGTIASNIRLGLSGLGDDDVRRAADRVCATAFIDRLPLGFATPVAERGATLSVGQKQLLALARALAFDPRILILDEATSSIDTDTERLIRRALAAVMAGRTTMAIAHRLSTIHDMDRILVLHRGELRESGTHQELLARRGLYHRLYRLQFQEGPGTGVTIAG